MTAVAHFPGSLDKGPLVRLRRPLQALAATILVVDLMGLGMHLADSAENSLANDTPTRARARVGGPEAVVPSTARPSGDVAGQRAARVEPVGCLAISSSCYAGPVAPPASPSGGATTPPAPSGGPAPSAPAPAPTPVAQAVVGVPALGVQADLGVGDGSCTGVALSALALGDCPVTSGDGPVTLKLGGSLLGG